MSNPAFTDIVIEGKRSEQRSLYEKMRRLQERKHPLIENGFYYPTRWLGNRVVIEDLQAGNEDPEKYVLVKEIEVISEADYW